MTESGYVMHSKRIVFGHEGSTPSLATIKKMKTKSISRFIKVSELSQYYVDEARKSFDMEVNDFCKDRKIIDAKITMQEGGQANWQGGVYAMMINALIMYEE